MLSYLGSYIWGAEEDEQVGIVVEVDGEDLEVICPQDEGNEWLLVAPKETEDSDNDEIEEGCAPEFDEELELMESALMGMQEFFAMAEACLGKKGRHTTVRFIPLKELNDRVNSTRRFVSPKNLKRANFVQARACNARSRKQFGRMDGKHCGMVASRFGKC